MRSVNKVILIGNLTRDPEMRQTANGQTVTTFCIATNREWVTKDGSKHGLAEYHDIVAWARLAEICSKYLKKGKLVYVEGYLKTRSWDTPEGVKKFRTEVVSQDMIMLEKRPSGDSEDYIPEEEIGAFNEEATKAASKTPVEAKKPEAAPETPAETPEVPAEPEVVEEAKEEGKKEEEKTAEDKPAEEEKKLDISGDLGL